MGGVEEFFGNGPDMSFWNWWMKTVMGTSGDEDQTDKVFKQQFLRI